MNRRRWCAALCAGLAAPAFVRTTARADDVATLVGLAYRYGLPAYELARVRYGLQDDPARRFHLRSNVLLHSRRLATPAARTVTAPNADTLYSQGVLDLRGGPVRIEVPEFGDRYYSIAFVDPYTNDFAYVGRRTTGTRAGSFLVVAPHDEVPAGNVPVIHAPSPTAMVLVRILLYGESDLATVHRLQDGIVLTASGPLPVAPAPVAPVAGNAASFVGVVNAVLAANPPPSADAPMLARIAAVGVGSSAAPWSAGVERVWNEHFGEVQHALVAATGRLRTIVNGWAYPPADIGRFGTDYDTRAQIALTGLLANVREEAFTVAAFVDAGGAPLDGAHAYRLRLPAKIPVDAFWSLSMYEIAADGRLYFAENPIHRYAIGDRTDGLVRSADGSLDIIIQRERPDVAAAANWLPMPAGPFRLALRNYQPQPALLDGHFRFPAIERAG